MCHLPQVKPLLTLFGTPHSSRISPAHSGCMCASRTPHQVNLQNTTPGWNWSWTHSPFPHPCILSSVEPTQCLLSLASPSSLSRVQPFITSSFLPYPPLLSSIFTDPHSHLHSPTSFLFCQSYAVLLFPFYPLSICEPVVLFHLDSSISANNFFNCVQAIYFSKSYV